VGRAAAFSCSWSMGKGAEPRPSRTLLWDDWMFEGDGTLLQKLPEDGPSSVTCAASQQHVSSKSSLIFRKQNFLLIAGVSNKVSKLWENAAAQAQCSNGQPGIHCLVTTYASTNLELLHTLLPPNSV